MKRLETLIPDLYLLEPKVFGDERGFFLETWNQKQYSEIGLNDSFVQDNLSCSCKGVLRGLHYQQPNAQGKLVSVLQGEVLDVAVDIRIGSPTFAKWEAIILSSENKRQLYLPPGFAHGFVVLSEKALFNYKCTSFYSAQDEGAIFWKDPDLAIDWRINGIPMLSSKDQKAPYLKDIPAEKLPEYGN